MARRNFLASSGLVLVSALGFSCSSSPPRDMWFGTDAGAGFEAPVRETAEDSANATDTSDSSNTDEGAADTTDDTSAPDASTD